MTEVTRAPQTRATHQGGRVQRGGDGLGTQHGLKTASAPPRCKVITAKAERIQFVNFFAAFSTGKKGGQGVMRNTLTVS